MIFIGILFLSLIGTAASQCACLTDDTIQAIVASKVVTSPTVDGTLSGTHCPANCSTTVTITGDLDGTPVGAMLNIHQADGFDKNNYVTIYNGDVELITINASSSGSFVVSATQSNIIKFTFSLEKAVKFVCIMTPTPQQSTTTTTTPAPTTTKYTHFPYNPAINVVDLTFVLDGSTDNTFLPQSKSMIADIAKYFNFDGNHARLSLWTFDPANIFSYGSAIPWTLNFTTLQTNMGNILPYAPGNSEVFEGLKKYFSINVGNFKFRNDTQRVLIYFTNQDSSPPSEDDINSVRQSIETSNLKIIFVNMDANKNTDGADYNNLQKLATTDSNNVNFYTYKGKNDADYLIQYVYQNGVQMCNLPVKQIPISTTGVILPLTVPVSPADAPPDAPASVYCNYINFIQQYNAAEDPTKTLQVSFSEFKLNYNYDYVTIYTDGKPVYTFSGEGYGTFLCLNANSTYGVGFSSQGDKVYEGFTANFKRFDTPDECKTTPPSPNSGSRRIFEKSFEYRYIEI